MLYSSRYMTFWKRITNIVTVIISVAARGKGENGMSRQNIGDFNGSENALSHNNGYMLLYTRLNV